MHINEYRRHMRARRVARVVHLLLIAGLVTAIILLSGCTVFIYEDDSGKTVSAWDFHPVGGAVDIEVARTDGTVIRATRQQESSEQLVEAAVSAAIRAASPIP